MDLTVQTDSMSDPASGFPPRDVVDQQNVL